MTSACSDNSAGSLPRLRVITRARPASVENPLADIAGEWDHVWARGETSMVGAGEVLRVTARGDTRIGGLAETWRGLSALAEVDDAVAEPGTGLAAFSSISFSRASVRDSVLVVPDVVWGRKGDSAWITVVLGPDAPVGLRIDPSVEELEAYARDVVRVGTVGGVRGHAELGNEFGAELGDDAQRNFGDEAGPELTGQGRISETRFQRGVSQAVSLIHAGALDKAVISRDSEVRVPGGVPVVETLRGLAARYTDCWTYSVDGIMGATPEMLIEAHDGIARARVLAGTLDRAGRGEDGAFELAGDQKQIQEHRYAIDSLVEELAPYVSEMRAPQAPFVLTLPNVWHLASDVRARVGTGPSGPYGVLDLLRAVHPTAAVCGTPRNRAGLAIREIEGVDRGAYAGPVGWVDAHGNGEFGIALRCGVLDGFGPEAGAESEDASTRDGHPGPAIDAKVTDWPTTAFGDEKEGADPGIVGSQFPTQVGVQVADRRSGVREVPERIRLWAGCGIVADSNPEAELVETWAKMRPMLQALHVPSP